MSTDSDLRHAFAAHSRETLPGERCPSPERLYAAAADELDSGDARRVIDHVSRCPACAEDFRLSRRMAEAEPAEVRDVTWASRAWRPRRLGALAAAIAAVALGWQLLLPSPPPFRDTPFRDTAGETVRSRVPNGSTLPRQQIRLAWSGPEGARYDVLVTTGDLVVVIEVQGLEERRLVIPPAALADLPDGTVLFWQVEATLPDGSRLASHSFDVRLEK